MNFLESNGGFPEPPRSDPIRVVRAAHGQCGGETRIRLPGYLPPRAVRRVVCDRCHITFEAIAVEDLTAGSDPSGRGPAPAGGPAPKVRRRGLPPASSPVYRYLGIPLAALAVVAALILLQDEKDPSPTVTVGAPGATSVPADQQPAIGRGAGAGED